MYLNLRLIFAVLLMPFLIWGCATHRGPIPRERTLPIPRERTLPAPREKTLPKPKVTAPPAKSHERRDSRSVASHNLISQGQKLLEKGDIDGALRLLERAVGINPSDGPGYYYLAEAWLAKDNLPLSARFNKLAAIYLRKDSTWTRRAKDQTRRIESRRNHKKTSS